MDVFNDLQEIFRDVFNDLEMQLTNELSADDVDDWTSLTHVMLLAATEEHFGVKFSTKEIRRMRNVGNFISCIKNKVND